MPGFGTYDIVGAKEDVSDIISNISPTKTPFQSLIGNEKVHNTLFEWQEDSLRAVAANAAVEGADGSVVNRSPTVMRSNYTQILVDTYQISGTVEAVSTYGRGKESAYQTAKAMAAIKRDLEHAFVGSKQTAVAGTSAVARQMAGYQAQVDATLVVPTGGTTTALSEANLLTALQKLWDEGSDPDTIMATGADAQVISGFATATGRSRDLMNGSNGKKIVNTVDLYISPYGEAKVVLNRFLAAGDTLVFDPEMWKKVTLRPWTRETLAKAGDSLKMMIVGEFSLKHKNKKASAVIRRAAP